MASEEEIKAAYQEHLGRSASADDVAAHMSNPDAVNSIANSPEAKARAEAAGGGGGGPAVDTNLAEGDQIAQAALNAEEYGEDSHTYNLIGRDSWLAWSHLSDDGIRRVYKDVLGEDISNDKIAELRGIENTGEGSSALVGFWMHGQRGHLENKDKVNKEKAKEAVSRFMQVNGITDERVGRDRFNREVFNKDGKEGYDLADFENQWSRMHGDWRSATRYKGDLGEKGGTTGFVSRTSGLGSFGEGRKLTKNIQRFEGQSLASMPNVGVQGLAATMGGDRARRHAAKRTSDWWSVDRKYQRRNEKVATTVVGAFFGPWGIIAASAANQVGDRAMKQDVKTSKQFEDFAIDVGVAVATAGTGKYLQGSGALMTAGRVAAYTAINAAAAKAKGAEWEDAWEQGAYSALGAEVGGRIGNIKAGEGATAGTRAGLAATRFAARTTTNAALNKAGGAEWEDAWAVGAISAAGVEAGGYMNRYGTPGRFGNVLIDGGVQYANAKAMGASSEQAKDAAILGSSQSAIRQAASIAKEGNKAKSSGSATGASRGSSLPAQGGAGAKPKTARNSRGRSLSAVT
jgi:hypothetical protein